MKRKHSKNGLDSFRRDIQVACSSNLTQFQAAERRRIEYMKRGGILQPYEAEAFIVSAFERRLVSARVLPRVIELLRKPEFNWDCPPDSLWYLYNCFTTAIQKQRETNPQRFIATTMELMRLLGPKAGFDQPGSEANPIDIDSPTTNVGGAD